MGEWGRDMNDGVDPWNVELSDQIRNRCTSVSRTSHGGLQVRRDQVIDDHSGKSVAEGLEVLANASNVVASYRTDNAGGSQHQNKGVLHYRTGRTPEQCILLAEAR
jgi:hypothetical protein